MGGVYGVPPQFRLVAGADGDANFGDVLSLVGAIRQPEPVIWLYPVDDAYLRVAIQSSSYHRLGHPHHGHFQHH